MHSIQVSPILCGVLSKHRLTNYGYFHIRIALLDGSSLSLDQVYDWVISAVSGPNLRLPTAISPQGGITQDEHPILGLPFWYIHPCNTHSVMKQFDQHIINTTNYIKIWLSFYGPAAGCNLSSQLFLDMSNKAE